MRKLLSQFLIGAQAMLRLNFFLLILLVLILVISGFNFYPDFWLSGWDNLHAEFDFGLNLKRALFASWQEYQGLGLPAGHAHATELVRGGFLWLTAQVLPAITLRKVFVFLMLFLGPAGVYFLSQQLLGFKSESQKPQNFVVHRQLLSFLGAIFYLLNPVTLQIFYAPYEAFVVHYAALPWLIWSFLRFLSQPAAKNLFWLGVLNFLATPQAYVPTLFLVYLFILVLLGLSRKREILKRAGLAIGLVLLVNAFWLLPFLYFNFTNLSAQLEAWSNWRYSQDLYEKNLAAGGWQRTILLKGYWFDYVYQTEQGTAYLLADWKKYFDQPLITVIGYGFFVLVLSGAYFALNKRRNLKLVLLFLFFFGLLAIDAYPWCWLNHWLRLSSLFHQVFRNPFTKFANTLVLTEALLFVLGLRFLTRLLKRKIIINLTFVLIFLLQLVYLFPVFQGKLFYQDLLVKIPEAYWQLFSFFHQEEKGRIANFPQVYPNGWNYYRWGYNGSGFLWYGIEQPILDRAFDVWNAKNENYYWEVSRAVYSGDLAGLEAVLEKYQIRWLVIDENIITGGSQKSLYFDQLAEMLEMSQKIKKVKKIEGKGEARPITIYKVELATPLKDFVFLTEKLVSVGPQYRWNDDDQAFREFGHYLSPLDESPAVDAGAVLTQVYYPFRSLFTGRKQEELEFKVEDKGNEWVISAAVPNLGGQLVPPVLNETESVFWTKELTEEKLAPPEVWWYPTTLSEPLLVTSAAFLPAGAKIEIKWPKRQGYYTYDSVEDEDFFKQPMRSCDPFNDGWKRREKIIGEDQKAWLRFESQASSNCLGIDLPHLSQKIGYLVKVESRHLQGKPLLFYVINKTSQKKVIETYLPKAKVDGEKIFTENYFIVPPMEEYGQGYSLHLDNISVGKVKTVNELARLQVYPIPYRFLKTIKLISSGGSTGALRSFRSRSGKMIMGVKHQNPAWYEVRIEGGEFEGEEENMIILSQAYHPGWIAWEGKPFIGRRLKHFLVNNWENGFQLVTPSPAQTGKQTLYIFFWPQLLEDFGLGLLLLSGLFAVWKLFHKRNFHCL
jgi:hypothetical protein